MNMKLKNLISQIWQTNLREKYLKCLKVNPQISTFNDIENFKLQNLYAHIAFKEHILNIANNVDI